MWDIPWTEDWDDFFGHFEDTYYVDEFGTTCNSSTNESLDEERRRRGREVWERINNPPPQAAGRALNPEAQRRAEHLLRNHAALFARLSLQPTLSRKAVRQAYRLKALQTHPDKPGGSALEFRNVKAAADKIGTALIDLLTRYPELEVDQIGIQEE